MNPQDALNRINDMKHDYREKERAEKERQQWEEKEAERLQKEADKQLVIDVLTEVGQEFMIPFYVGRQFKHSYSGRPAFAFDVPGYRPFVGVFRKGLVLVEVEKAQPSTVQWFYTNSAGQNVGAKDLEEAVGKNAKS